uniref:NFKB activating protein n=1 Tax=Neogobius melanostomus TaxID=47308 RepID=A0A8C6SL58_9GOBI
MPSSDRSSSDSVRSPRTRRPRTRSRSRSRSRGHSLSPDSFGPKLPKLRNKEREREERDRRLREARNIKRIRIGSPHRSRSRSRSRSRDRHNISNSHNHWSEHRDGFGKHDGFRDEYYYEEQRDDAQRQRQEAFIARRLQERERIGELGCPEVWGYSDFYMISLLFYNIMINTILLCFSQMKP